MAYTVDPTNSAAPLDSDQAKYMAAEFRGLKGYVTKMPVRQSIISETLVKSDGGKCISHPAADTTARTWTIPANVSVAYDIGTCITFDNDVGAGAITIAINTDTLILAGAGTTGSRTLAASGLCTAIKIAATRWKISGVGLS